MNKNQLVFIILIVLATIWLIIKSMDPGGGSIIWFFALLLLTLVSYYYGFVDKSTNPLRFYSQAGFITFLLLTFLMAYIARVEDKGLEEISKYIAVYPNVESINFIPRSSEKTIQHWQLKEKYNDKVLYKWIAERQATQCIACYNCHNWGHAYRIHAVLR